MNPYKAILANATNEIDEFSHTTEGSKWDDDWYTRLKDLVADVMYQTDDEQAERYLVATLRFITDSGPLNSNLAPSIDNAALAMQKIQKRK